MTPRYFWEDFTEGAEFSFGEATPTREEMIAFASAYDPQPFHLDDDAAAASLFGGLCASGWHTCSMAMRLMVTNFLGQSSSLGSPGMENLKWLKPVYPGDVLQLTQHIVESRPMASRPDVGLIRSQWQMVNQHGQPVMQMEGYGMFRRRTPAAAQ